MQAAHVTGLVLAGGRGSRMGGIDKGLQPFCGQPLARRALQRLAPQVARVLLNANRHAEVYAGWGVPVLSDASPADFAGPLAGFLGGLQACRTPWLCTVPCDTPLFPADLVQRLGRAALDQGADIAIACARENDGQWRPQPVFCLMKASLADSLHAFMRAGGRKIDAWTAAHPNVQVRFDQPGDAAQAFFNANTLDELRWLESQAVPCPPTAAP